jgi:hypothetical protein
MEPTLPQLNKHTFPLCLPCWKIENEQRWLRLAAICGCGCRPASTYLLEPMKRILLLALCLTTAVLAGCASGSAGRERTAYTVPADNAITEAASPLSPAVDP